MSSFRAAPGLKLLRLLCSEGAFSCGGANGGGMSSVMSPPLLLLPELAEAETAGASREMAVSSSFFVLAGCGAAGAAISSPEACCGLVSAAGSAFLASIFGGGGWTSSPPGFPTCFSCSTSWGVAFSGWVLTVAVGVVWGAVFTVGNNFVDGVGLGAMVVLTVAFTPTVFRCGVAA